jgi:hypothetical protein
MAPHLKKDQDEIQPGRKDNTYGALPYAQDHEKTGAQFKGQVSPEIVEDAQSGGEEEETENPDPVLLGVAEDKVGGGKDDDNRNEPEQQGAFEKIFHCRSPRNDLDATGRV